MDDFAIARALHLLAVVHWIGGVALVTAVILPAVGRLADPARRAAVFEEIEGRFSRQAKFSVALAGLSGVYMVWRVDAWSRFADPHYWWMHAMVAVWALFALVLYVAEPLFLDRWFRRRAARDAAGTFALVRRAHWVLLTLAGITVAGAALGARGAI